MTRLHYILLFALLVCLTVSCHTGIESTKTITLSKSERKQLEASPEEKLMEDVKAPMLSEWKEGKKFLVSDNRASLVFDPYSMINDQEELGGKIIEYAGVTLKATPGGADEAVIVFKNGSGSLQYSTGKNTNDAATSISSMDVPMLIDLELVDKVKDLLVGRKVWTRSQLWYDRNENKIDGRKFVPVEIVDVNPGTMVFPLKVYLIDENGKPAMMYMNAGTAGIESRTFQNLFSLTDPKDRYPSIHEDVWELIQRGQVRLGMTKEECKLALGNPSDVNSGHDWNSTIDFWQYPNGSYLRFQDGLLVAFRN